MTLLDFVLSDEFVWLESRETWLHGELIIHVTV